MPDFSPNFFIPRDEIIGDINTSSDYNSSLDTQTRLPDRNVPTNIVAKAFLYVLDFLLMIILLPFTTCQKIYGNDHLMVMFRVILEVSLELAMWLVLAGVSILTSAALIFDDLYSGKEGSEGYRRLVKKSTIDPEQENRTQEQPASEIVEEKSTPRDKNDRTEETGVDHSINLHGNRERIYSKNRSLMPENPSRTESRNSEKDDDRVLNFSFYKPLQHGINAASSTAERKRFGCLVNDFLPR